MVGDGSAMYTIQSLWTQAREGLNVVTIVFANRIYQILRGEFDGVGAGEPGQRAQDMLKLDRPTIDFVALAKGMGVEGRAVTNADEFNKALAEAVAAQGPRLIEVQMCIVGADSAARAALESLLGGRASMQTELGKLDRRAPGVLRARSLPPGARSRRAHADPSACRATSKSSFPGWEVDCDYDRLGERTMRLPHGSIVSTDDHLGKSVYPDIVVHQRDIPNNLLAIEVRKATQSPADRARPAQAEGADRSASVVRLFHRRAGDAGATSTSPIRKSMPAA